MSRFDRSPSAADQIEVIDWLVYTDNQSCLFTDEELFRWQLRFVTRLVKLVGGESGHRKK